ncbi:MULTISPECIES: motility protein A [Oceanibaculum]|uniref:Chemotaxis protein n=1 Tax=Oceanibaculum indicum P24 TaxID=1207063 RepID=K2JIW7_9PROT|nr:MULTISPECIES: MotA/TolQ/ExbB proton channel family protein [Oceanibaculum]EKE70534.1 chemotaxis protein [Oceanibaculum indicum P24]MCH2394712.1 MotA/TolQ/ExbB proton channel family protein [Oceanibaculum sp.]
MSDVSSKTEAAAGRAAPAAGIRMATNRADLVPPGSRMVVDFATILGLVGGFGMIFAAMSISGSSAAFLDIPSVLIVLGGTFAVTLVCYSLRDALRAHEVIGNVLLRPARNAQSAAVWMLHLSEIARAKGVLALESGLSEMQREPFLHKAVQMVVDGSPADEVERIMRQEMAATAMRQTQTAGMLRKAAEVAPAMGLIGTLVGLVQMLGRLSDPSSIGPAMAVALLTTFYGAVLAYMVFAPLASKLERNMGEDQMVSQIYLIGAASIARQEHPRRTEMQINTVLPPAQRIDLFD